LRANPGDEGDTLDPIVPLLQACNLRKVYAGRVVVNDVSFHVERSEIVGLLGRNGAGKTTSFRMTIGMIDADGGRVFFRDEEVSGLPMYQRARRGMGYLSQEPSVFSRMTVEENLLAILETQRVPKAQRRDRAGELMARFGLAHKARHAARTCSGGERRKLEIARALVTQPGLILLDEPFSGVDPIAVEDLQEEIRRLASQGIACLITDHNVQQTLRVCDRAYIIDEGRVFAEGTPRELINNEMVKRVYLGSLFRGDEFDRPLPQAQGTQPAPQTVHQVPLRPITVHASGNGHPVEPAPKPRPPSRTGAAR
jgi:lipopolysaccharide export system ATP-binding protein